MVVYFLPQPKVKPISLIQGLKLLKAPGEKSVINLDKTTKVSFINGQYVDFLEALTDGPISPHDKLETLFNYYKAEWVSHKLVKRVLKLCNYF